MRLSLPLDDVILDLGPMSRPAWLEMTSKSIHTWLTEGRLLPTEADGP